MSVSNACKFCGVDVTLFRWCQNQACKLYNTRVPAASEFAFGSALCELCNGLLSFSNPCPECLQNEPGAILKRFEQADKDALKAELGYSSEVKWRAFNEDAGDAVGKEWRGYRLELLGIELGHYSSLSFSSESLQLYEKIGAMERTASGYAIIKPSLLLPFTCIPDRANPDLIVKLSRIRAFYKNSPLYSEMRSNPYGVRRVAICGLENRHKKKDLDKAFEGLDLLRAAAKKLGRTKGSRTYSEASFRRRARLAYRDFYDRTGEYPSGELLAIEMHLSRAAFYDHLKAYDLTVSDIRDLAME